MATLSDMLLIIETILIKSCLLFLKSDPSTLSVYEDLGSVCGDWRNTIRERRVCKRLSIKLLDNFKSLITQHHKLLVEHMECRYGLLTHLQNYGVLSKDQADKIHNGTRSHYDANRTLLDMLQNSTNPWAGAMFWKAMNNSYQSHITRYINGGECNADDRPLTTSELDEFENNQDLIVTYVVPSEEFLHDILLSCGISVQHMDAITITTNRYNRMSNLMFIMYRRSLFHVKKFIELCYQYCPVVNDIVGTEEFGILGVRSNECKGDREEMMKVLMDRMKGMSNDEMLAYVEEIKKKKEQKEEVA